MKTFFQKNLFSFKQFRIVQTSEVFSIRDILLWKHILYFQMWLSETFVLYLCNFDIAENVNIAGIAFLHKCKYLQI